MKTNFAILGGLLALSGMVQAQAVSYNANSVPIGGANNSGFGLSVLTANTSGNHNAGCGNYALLSNTSGVYNAAMGLNALRFNTTGNYNSALGGASVYQNTTGSENVGVGVQALRNNTTGNKNTALGTSALLNSNADLNTATGFETMFTNTSGSENTGLGSRALYSNSAGKYNVAVGYQALYSTTGDGNQAFGYQCMYSNTSGLQNTGVGYKCLYSNTTGNNNNAFGLLCMQNNTTGNQNTAMGATALGGNTSGSYNAAFGNVALSSNTTGWFNTAIGDNSMPYSSTGVHNAGLGYASLLANTTGHFNTACGSEALYGNTTGLSNTSAGRRSLYNNTTGSYNSAVGEAALINNGIGEYNVSVGYKSGNVPNGNNENTFVGAFADLTPFSSFNHATALGANAVVNASNRVWLGSAADDVWGAVATFIASDQRFKSSVKEDDVKGLEFIKLLRPVVYNFEAKKFTEHLTAGMPDSVRKSHLDRDFSKVTAIRQTGFLAQEVEAAAEKSGYNFNGVHKPESDHDTYGISYATFVVPLVKAVQEQQQQIEKQDATIAAQQKQIDELKAMVQTLAGYEPSKATAVAVSLSDKNTVVLNQNVPNPFAESTVISYNIPSGFSKAQMVFSTADGRAVKTVDLTVAKGSLTVFAEDLSGGIYTYSLVVDGKTLDTKKMIKE
jgi:trimeric autotransporter adhesin